MDPRRRQGHRCTVNEEFVIDDRWAVIALIAAALAKVLQGPHVVANTAVI